MLVETYQLIDEGLASLIGASCCDFGHQRGTVRRQNEGLTPCPDVARLCARAF